MGSGIRSDAAKIIDIDSLNKGNSQNTVNSLT